MSVYRRMKVTNLATGQFVGYLGKGGVAAQFAEHQTVLRT